MYASKPYAPTFLTGGLLVTTTLPSHYTYGREMSHLNCIFVVGRSRVSCFYGNEDIKTPKQHPFSVDKNYWYLKANFFQNTLVSLSLTFIKTCYFVVIIQKMRKWIGCGGRG